MKDGHLEGSIGDFQKDGALRYYDKANFEKADYGAWQVNSRKNGINFQNKGGYWETKFEKDMSNARYKMTFVNSPGTVFRLYEPKEKYIKKWD